MKEQYISSHEAPRETGLTRYPSKPYAEYGNIFMSDSVETTEVEQAPTQEFNPQHQKTEKQGALEGVFLRIQQEFGQYAEKLQKERGDFKKLDKDSLKQVYDSVSGKIQALKETSKGENKQLKKTVREALSPARKLQRQLRNLLLKKRVEEQKEVAKKEAKTAKEKKEQRADEALLRRHWEHRFTKEELEQEDVKQTVKEAVSKGLTPDWRDDEELKEIQEITKKEKKGEISKEEAITLRLEKAEEILSDLGNTDIDLTSETEDAQKKRQAIIAAHEVAEEKEFFEHDQKEIIAKAKLLSEAGFKRDEYSALIARGITGNGDEGGEEESHDLGGGDVDPITGAPLGGAIGATHPERDTGTSQDVIPAQAERRRQEVNFSNATLDVLEAAAHNINTNTERRAIHRRLGELLTAADDKIAFSQDPRVRTIQAGIEIAGQIPRIAEEEAYEQSERQAAAYGETKSTAYHASERKFYEGPPSKIINELVNAVNAEPGVYNYERKRVYYNNLKRYVKYVLDNAYDPNDPDNPERQLHMDPVVLERLKEIFDTATEEIIIPGEEDVKMKENANYLLDTVKLDQMFKGLDREKEAKGSRYLPNSIDELCNLIVQNYGIEFAPGSKYELVNTKNEFQIQNFLAFIRLRMKDLDDGNPNADIDPLTQIAIQSEMSSVNLLSIILTPRYTSTRKVQLSNSGVGAEVNAELGPLQEQEDLKDGKWIFLREAWMFGLNHNYDAAYRSIRGVEQQVPETLMKLFRNSDFTGDSRILKLFKLAATDLKEFREYRDNEKQGEVGKAMRQMVLAYNYLAHFSENKDRDFKNNMFYKVMGEDGMNAFFNSLASDALSSDSEAKENYKKYIKWMLEEEKKKNPDHSDLIDRKLREVESLDFSGARPEALMKGATQKTSKLDIRLDYMAEIEDIRMEIKKMEVRHELTDDEKDEVRQSIRKSVSQTVNEHFLNLVKSSYADKAGKTSDKKEQEKYQEISQAMDHFTSNKEKFALDLVEKLLTYNRDTLNFFKQKKPEEALEKMMKKAIENGACRQRDLSDDDAGYAGMWAWRFRNWTGIAARNDTGAVGFDAWSKLMHTKDYRIRQEAGRSGGGNRHTISGLRRMSLSFWEGIEFRKEGSDKTMRLIDALQGDYEGTGDHVDLKNDIVKGVFGNNVMSDFADTHMGNSMKFFTLVGEEMYMDLDKLVELDHTGRLMINEKAFFNVRDKWYKNIRYCYDQMDFDYDKKINVWTRVNKVDHHTHKVERDKNGVPKTELKFQSISVRDYFFDHEVNHMGMYKRFGKYPDAKDSEKRENKMARNVFAYLISKEIGHHLEKNRIHHGWNIEQVRMIQQVFEYMAQDMEREEHGHHEHVKVANSFFSKKEFNTILEHAGKKSLKIGDLQLLSAFGRWDTGIALGQTAGSFAGGIFGMLGQMIKASLPTSGGGGGGGGGHSGGHGGGHH